MSKIKNLGTSTVVLHEKDGGAVSLKAGETKNVNLADTAHNRGKAIAGAIGASEDSVTQSAAPRRKPASAPRKKAAAKKVEASQAPSAE